MSELSIYTLNTWFPPYSQHRAARARAISQEILRLTPDVVCLQELFLSEPRQIVTSALAAAYPYRRYFESGWIGSGLFIASRLPVVYSAFERYRLGGKPEDIKHGDYYAGKGISMIRVRLNDADIDIYNTHTHAQYEPADDNEYAFFNLSNLWQAARFVKRVSGDNRRVLVGDLNSRPDQLGYRLLRQIVPLQDAFTALHPDQSGYTFRASNPYATGPNQRLDYVLHSSGLIPTDCTVLSSDVPANGALAFSDHDALIAHFDVAPQTAVMSKEDEGVRSASVALAVRELKFTDNQELRQLETLLTTYLLRKDALRLARLLSIISSRLAHTTQRLITAYVVVMSLLTIFQLLVTLPRRRAAIARAIDDITEPS
ncbi:endonuclease/exonuclease/phosphatase family protein [Aggregatilineales bacterium SYSU G02658]